HIDGFFQQYFDFPAACCRPVDSSVRPEHLAFAEPLACALHAVNRARVAAGDRVLVTGCGPMGLLTIIAAAAKGADVTCVDLRQEAIDAGLRIGAKTGKRIGAFAAADIDQAFDAAIEASGAVPAFNQALEAVKKGGTVSILSNLQPGASGIDIHRIMLKELMVVGSFQFHREFDEALAVIAQGTFDFDALIARQFGLSQTRDAFALALSGTAVGKVQIVGARAPCP
ncbi:MAG: L-idonate 5-dehydrogenase, partial [Alphaproteobacteria bacterium]